MVKSRMICRYEQVCVIENDEMQERIEKIRGFLEKKELNGLLILNGVWEGYSHWLVGSRVIQTIYIPREGKTKVFYEKDTGGVYYEDYEYSHIEYLTADAASYLAAYWKEYGGGSIGIVQKSALTHEMITMMEKKFIDISFVECDQQIDVMKAIKSDKELECLGRTNQTLENIMEELKFIIKPGKTIRQINYETRYFAEKAGCGGEKSLFYAMQYGADDGTPLHYADCETRAKDYIVKSGDRIFMMLEGNSAGGMFSALGRNFILGTPCSQTVKYWDIAVKAQQYAASQLKPGTALREIFDSNCQYIKAEGYQTNQQNYLHSFGYVFGERPYLHDRSENEKLVKGMHYIVHPHICISRNANIGMVPYDDFYCVDTYYISENGGICANNFPKDLIIIGGC